MQDAKHQLEIFLNSIENIKTDWKDVIKHIISENNECFKKLLLRLGKDLKMERKIYPEFSNTFHCFNLFNIKNTKVVILGQDPYHTPNKAMGLSFSIPSSEKLPPSLKNIYKELKTDIPNFVIPESGDLTKWAEQGVLLLNSALSVIEKQPNSHQNEWIFLSDAIIKYISEECTNVVFILWGNFARNKKSLINSKKHYILESAHPSPFSASRGFFNSKPFSKTNNYLKESNKTEINWSL